MQSTFAWERDPELQGSACCFNEAPQRGKVQVGLTLDLMHRRLFDAERFRDLFLTTIGENTKSLQPFNFLKQFLSPYVDRCTTFSREAFHNFVERSPHFTSPFYL